MLTDEVDEVVLPGSQGQLGVLPGHIPLLTKLQIGEMLVRDGGEERRFFVNRGFAEILGDQVRVLAQECEGVDEIDVEAARDELQEAEREVRRLEDEGGGEDEELLDNYRESLRKNRKRLMMSGEDVDE